MKINYFKQKSALNIPWVESPFFYDLLENSSLSSLEQQMATKYHEDGYLILDLDLSDEFINNLVEDVKHYLSIDQANRQEEYEYNDSPRPFQLWKKSEFVKQLSLNQRTLDVLSFLYGRKAFPFSTINFLKGTEQPLHSDTIHFHSIPQLWMVGSWVALEDMDENNGALRIVPGSHKWGTFDYSTMNLPHPDEIENGYKVNYKKYEHFIHSLIQAKKAKELVVNMKKGQALIWSANLLHGGSDILDPSRTRRSQAIHYFFEGCEKYYSPMFSNPFKGEYAEKWCSESNNITNFKGEEK